MSWLCGERAFLRREWRRLKKREAQLERNNCPLLARQVRAAADRFEAQLNALDF